MRQSQGEPCVVARGVSIGHWAARGGGFHPACIDIDVEVLTNEFVVIVGPSGCGKSTFLEALAGLVPIASGTLTAEGQEIDGPSLRRSLVFQSPSLFPWRTVKGNVEFALQANGQTQGMESRAEELLELVGLADVRHKHPRELSGGMRQRVNIARALATDPAILLLDEPFGALDALTRETMQDELLAIWRTSGIGAHKTAVMVTHDIREAVLLGDRVVVFSDGPAHVKETIDIDVHAANRDSSWRTSPEFNEYCERVKSTLYRKSSGPSRRSAAAHGKASA